MRMYFDYPWLIPLGRTILSRGLVKALTSGDLNWGLGERKLRDGSVRVVKRCSIGKLTGRMLEVVRKGEVIFRLCASPEASLPIYLLKRSPRGTSTRLDSSSIQI